MAREQRVELGALRALHRVGRGLAVSASTASRAREAKAHGVAHAERGIQRRVLLEPAHREAAGAP